jgi:SAM-dependent methyltransferase
MTSNQYVDGTYLQNVGDWHAGDSPWKARQVYSMIAKHKLTPALVYDVGCGAGQILVELQRRLSSETKLAGFDISPQAIDMAKPKENSRLKFQCQDFLNSVTAAPDLVLLLDVFEHVPDYIGFLNQIKKRSAWIIFHIPLDACAKDIIGKSHYMLYMRERYGHLHYFTKESAIATLTNAGFDVVDWFFTNDFEISKDMIPGWRKPKARIIHEVRRLLYRFKPSLAAACFSNFNLMLLAKGDVALTEDAELRG